MVRSRYPNLTKQRHRWFVRMVVPPDVRGIIGEAVFKVATGYTDEHKAIAAATPIIAGLQGRIAAARLAGKRLEQVTAEQLAERYRAERDTDPDKAELTKVTDVIEFVLKIHGHSHADLARQIVGADYNFHTALRLLPDNGAAANAANRIIGHATPVLTYLKEWKSQSGLKPRPLDQATSSLKQFDQAVGKPIEGNESKDVQQCINGLINAEAEKGLNSRTVNRKLGEIRNYWNWLQSLQIVQEDQNPFSRRRVRDPAHRRKGKDDQRQRFRPEDIVKFEQAAIAKGDTPSATAIRIAAFSGARIEGVSQLQATDIRVDPDIHPNIALDDGRGAQRDHRSDQTSVGETRLPRRSIPSKTSRSGWQGETPWVR